MENEIKSTASLVWKRGEQSFSDGRYSRAHVWSFDGGTKVEASSSPHVVPLPMSTATAVDPEEAFVASLSSCHMLTFLNLARKAKLVVDAYEDEAEGTLVRGEGPFFSVARVVLRPKVTFSGSTPSAETLGDLHRRAHDECFIARSVKSEVRVEPR